MVAMAITLKGLGTSDAASGGWIGRALARVIFERRLSHVIQIRGGLSGACEAKVGSPGNEYLEG